MEPESKIFVKKSDIQGNGMFARRAIKKNESVHFMTGQEISLLKCIALILLRKVPVDNPLQIEKWSYMILDETSVAVNHSCDPNCTIVGKNELIAIKDIEVGEEITFDYSLTVIPNFYTKYWKMTCGCGSEKCRKYVSNIDSIGKNQLMSYLRNNQMQQYALEFLKKNRPQLLETTVVCSV